MNEYCQYDRYFPCPLAGATAAASVLTPAFFAQLFEVRQELPWVAVTVLALVAGATIVVLERVLPDAATRRT